MLTSGVVLLCDNAWLHTAARTRALLEHFNGSYLTTLHTALISLWVTATCLPTWKTGWGRSASTIMKNWWKEAHRLQTSLTQTYKNLLHDMTGASVLAVTTLRSSWSMYIFSLILFFLIPYFVSSSPEVTFWITLVHQCTAPNILIM
jgi:hypothetical protein